MPAENRPRRRRKKRSSLYEPAAFLLICAAIVFSLGVFFRVSTIEVEGGSRYSDQEIIDASGIETGDNIFFINRFTAVSRIFSKLPYIESATINRHMPGRVVIEVEESRALAYVTVESDCWLIDRNCKLLEKVTASEAAAYISILGLSPIAPAVGEIVSPGLADETKVDFLAALLSGMQERDMQGDVYQIDMSNISDATFRYVDRFTVKFGNNENVDYKLDLLLSAVAQLAVGDAGTIDITADKKVSFSPE
jgi:cell division protein FtsQ